MTILRIFAAFFRVGALTLGGGLAMISVLRHEMVVKRAWVGEEDFTRELSAAMSLPGAIVINFSLFSGYRMRGAPGAAAAFLGAVLPSLLAIILVALLLFPYFSHPTAAAFLRGASASVAGLLAHTAFTMCRPMITRAPQLIAAMIAAALALVPGINPIFALIAVTAFVFRLSSVHRARAIKRDDAVNDINAGGGIIRDNTVNSENINLANSNNPANNINRGDNGSGDRNNNTEDDKR
ncbi:MAG: chromate transporter [Chitinispirillia bacterium]|nr:chromate transporter [Chitinispirillia bacterium]MCL2269228.1 chromate transporter [Chitinispirillia bacterium]